MTSITDFCAIPTDPFLAVPHKNIRDAIGVPFTISDYRCYVNKEGKRGYHIICENNEEEFRLTTKSAPIVRAMDKLAEIEDDFVRSELMSEKITIASDAFTFVSKVDGRTVNGTNYSFASTN